MFKKLVKIDKILKEVSKIIIENKIPIKKIDIARRKFSVTNFILK